MYIKNAELKNFRNYEDLKLRFHQKVNIITGENAQGKTNLLEAIYISSLSRSFRTNRDSEMIRFGSGFCRVKIIAEKDSEELPVEIIIKKEGKKIKVGDVKIRKISELLKNILTVIFSPEDLKIVKEEPEKRRRFMDRELCQLKPAYLNRLTDYKKTLKQRNAYLKESETDSRVLEIWNEQLAETGAFIMQERAAFIEKIQKISAVIHSKITNGKEEFKISYEPNIDRVSVDMQSEVFLRTLIVSRERDRKKRTTTRGPHRDDFKIEVNGVDMRHFGSQGQQRTAALSLKLAELRLIKEETGEDAILLLDDVMSELDMKRQSFLIEILSDVQLFITTAEISPGLLTSLPSGSIYHVENGTVEEKDNL